ncbi:glycosyltransferase family 2 protein [Chroococcidiopsis sp. CCMEE 29]|uniref:glycosyltransferase family 2 protein n=1 Tax=Chroococcidiopsis sp. CCMEE 29 TaxID=155894 RepID=UPI002020D1B0|nr:glycosyltransferase family 2 protein [Chroococcidiopsis sp. CCMEE 29]
MFTQCSLDIIIVNWNSGKQLRQALLSIVSTNKDGFVLNRVVVVDNASWDNSLEELEGIGLPLTVIRNRENRGFAAACNQGAKGSKADYLLFLNPDTRLFMNSLVKPIEFMQQPENANFGICGIQLVDENGNVNRHCCYFPLPKHFFSKILGLNLLFPRRFPTYFMAGWNHAGNREVEHVIGAFYLVRCSVFISLDGFDERFFVYLEDLDFSYRAYQANWSSYYLADAQAFHKGGGTSEQVKAIRLFYSLYSRILYVYKHFPWLIATSLMLATLLIEPLVRVGGSISSRSTLQLQETLEGSAKLWWALTQRTLKKKVY